MTLRQLPVSYFEASEAITYRKPFDLRQRQVAARTYRSLRSHRRTIARDFPPKSANMRCLLRDYRRLLDALLDELIKPDGKVNVVQLNRILADLTVVEVTYMQQNDHGDAP